MVIMYLEMKKYMIAIAPFFALLAIILYAVPAYAFIDSPDSTPTIESKKAYRNILETGDMLIIVYANIPYSSEPEIAVDDAFIWRVRDGDTLLGCAVGYPYNSNGYGYNVYAFYFSADDAPTWGEAYTLRLSGTPYAFEDIPEYNFTLQGNDYSNLTDSDDVKAELASDILTIATDLDNKWALETGYSLLLEVETGTVLSIYGEAFFRGAVYGIQALAPSLFRLQYLDMDAEDREWSETYINELEAQWNETWVGDAREAGKSVLDVDFNLFGIILTLIHLHHIYEFEDMEIPGVI